MKGNILKLKTDHQDIVQYHLPIGEDLVHLNPLIGKDISLKYTGKIHCIATGKKIKKSYGQGYSFESFITLPQCDECIFRPELCHFASGTCRDEEWGLKNCFKNHVIYLANSSGVKVGITRNVPNRWMDQGAIKAIKVCEVKDRKTSGLIEVEIAKKMTDKTNWRKMLKNDVEEVDLLSLKKEVIDAYADLLKKHEAQISDDETYEFNYPVEKYPEKVKSYNLDKDHIINDKLMGIKGQYLIFENGVINIRKYQGYELELSL